MTAENGTVTLSGPILTNEVDGLLACVRGVPGVTRVENRVETHDRADDHPALRGGVPRTGGRGELFQTRWSPTFRLLAGAVGVGLMTNCVAKRDIEAALLGTLGFGLFLRAATNTGPGELIGEALPAAPGEGSSELLAAAAAGPGL